MFALLLAVLQVLFRGLFLAGDLRASRQDGALKMSFKGSDRRCENAARVECLAMEGDQCAKTMIILSALQETPRISNILQEKRNDHVDHLA